MIIFKPILIYKKLIILLIFSICNTFADSENENSKINSNAGFFDSVKNYITDLTNDTKSKDELKKEKINLENFVKSKNANQEQQENHDENENSKIDDEITFNTLKNQDLKKENFELEIPKIDQKKIIYLDYNASTPFFQKDVLKLFIDALRYCGNPHANHERGIFLNKVVEHSKKVLAKIINATESEIFITSGATESNNLAIFGYVRSLPKNSHIITSQIEHKSVLEVFRQLKNEGYDITILPVNEKGFVEIKKLIDAIKPNTKFISIQYVNNEIGTIQNIKEIGKICKERNIKFHTDATQAFAKINIDVKNENIDMLTASSHKIHGISGVGLLYISKSIQNQIKPIFYGGDQQNGIRPGTIPVPLLVAFAKSAEIYNASKEINNKKINDIGKEFHEEMLKINSKLEKIDGLDVIELNGDLQNRIPGNFNYTIRGVDSADLKKYMKTFAFSNGSACQSSEHFSYVIESIDKNYDKSPTNIRISFGIRTKRAQLNKFINQLTKTLIYLRTKYPDRGKRTCKMENIEIK